MEPFLFAVAVCTLGALLFPFVIVARTVKTIPLMENIEEQLPGDGPAPRVSIIVTARNEERDLEDSLRSMLRLDYPDYEIIAVDDRSTDGTGEIVDRLSAEDGRIRALHVTELPPGWYGKSHAAFRAAEMATGELLLFTDADTEFAPPSLIRSVRYLLREELDHLTASPRFTAQGLGAQTALMGTAFNAIFLARPWKIRDPNSSVAFAIGPFILVRADAYRAIGGHQRIAISPAEDTQFGRLVKRSGLRSDIIVAEGMITFKWYGSARGMIGGLEKNTFANFNYSIAQVILKSVLTTWLAILPFFMAFVADGWARGIFGVCIALILALGIGMTLRNPSMPWWRGLLLPIGILMIEYATWRSMIVSLRHGVTWGGVRFSLEEIRKQHIY